MPYSHHLVRWLMDVLIFSKPRDTIFVFFNQLFLVCPTAEIAGNVLENSKEVDK